MKSNAVTRFTVVLLISWAGISARADQNVEYFDHNIKPIFASRCVQCHSCYNSPCQLKLDSVEGLDRGLVKNYEVFNPGKLKPVEPSRLGIDRKTTEGWRNFTSKIHFMPVTEDTGDVQKNLDSSFILKLVQQKQQNSSLIINDLDKPEEAPEASRICPETPKDLTAHLMARSNAGMPYGLPPLSESQIQKIKTWTEMGSPRSFVALPVQAKDDAQVRHIVGFLNSYLSEPNLAEAKRRSLVSRYIYEHLFLAHIYLRQEAAPDAYYSLVRSRTSCDKPDEIASRRPWDATGVSFFYCLKRIDSMIVHKTHMPYLIDDSKLSHWNQMFFASSWQVSFSGPTGVADVAPRADAQANNPFYVFRDVPAKAKYQFLLDDAQYHVMTFIKGPVCKGSTAVNSIDEQFYVLFLKPESDLMVRNSHFTAEATPLLYLPAYKGSGQILGATVALEQRNARNDYRVLRDRYYGAEFPKGYAVSDIWNGDSGTNQNAALTVLRHQDSATVEKGLIGATSKTVFVLDYSIFERIYYNLVAGFDVFGDASHQVHTRLYMSYTKMEAEENFLSFLPSAVRSPMRRSWYLQSNSLIEVLDKKQGDLIAGSFPLLGLEKGTQVNLPAFNENAYAASGIIQKLSVLRQYRRSLMDQFKSRLGTAVVDNNQLNPDKPLLSKSSAVRILGTETTTDFEKELAKLSDLPALNSPWILKMPSTAVILVESPQGPQIYTLVRNKEHLNIAWLSHESGRRNEAADTLLFYKGILTSYPNFIFHFHVREGREFLEGMMGLTDQASVETWNRRFGSPRNGPGSEKFWPTSDRLHQVFQQKYPREYGILDYNRYGVDYRYYDDESGTMFENLPKELRTSIEAEVGAK